MNWAFLGVSILQPGAAERRRLTPDGYSSHAQQYRFFY